MFPTREAIEAQARRNLAATDAALRDDLIRIAFAELVRQGDCEDAPSLAVHLADQAMQYRNEARDGGANKNAH